MKTVRLLSALLLGAGITNLQGMEQKFPIQQLPDGALVEVCKSLKSSRTRYIDIVQFFKDLQAWKCTCKKFNEIAKHPHIQNLCKQLKELVAQNNKIDESGGTPLHNKILASNKETPRETFMQLLEAGANVNKDNKYRESPLYFIMMLGHQLELIKLLLEYGADINKTDNKSGGTPLHIATLKGLKDIVECLLANGADVTKTTNYGQTAWGIAKEKGHEEIATLLVAAEEEQEKRQQQQQNETSNQHKKNKKECAIQ